MKKLAIVLTIVLSVIIAVLVWLHVEYEVDVRARDLVRVAESEVAAAETRMKEAEARAEQAEQTAMKRLTTRWVSAEEMLLEMNEKSRKAEDAQAEVDIERKRRGDKEAESERKEKEEAERQAEFERQMGLVQSPEQLAAEFKTVGTDLLGHWVDDAKNGNVGDDSLLNMILRSEITIPEVKKEFFGRVGEAGETELTRRIIKGVCDEGPVAREAVMNLKKLRRSFVDTKEISPDMVKEIVRDGTFVAAIMRNLVQEVPYWVPDMDRPETPEERKVSIGMVWRPFQEKYCAMVESGEINRSYFMTFETEEFTAMRKERAIKNAKPAKTTKH